MFPKTDLIFCKEDKTPKLTLFPALTSVKEKKKGIKIRESRICCGVNSWRSAWKKPFSCSRPHAFPTSLGTALQPHRSRCQRGDEDLISSAGIVGSCFAWPPAEGAALCSGSPGNELKQDLAPRWLGSVKFSPFICWRNSSITPPLQSFWQIAQPKRLSAFKQK